MALNLTQPENQASRLWQRTSEYQSWGNVPKVISKIIDEFLLGKKYKYYEHTVLLNTWVTDLFLLVNRFATGSAYLNSQSSRDHNNGGHM